MLRRKVLFSLDQAHEIWELSFGWSELCAEKYHFVGQVELAVVEADTGSLSSELGVIRHGLRVGSEFREQDRFDNLNLPGPCIRLGSHGVARLE